MKNNMNIFYKNIIYIILLSSQLLGVSNLQLKILNDSFYEKVVKTNIYKKRFDKYLNKNCPDSSSQCYKTYIDAISKWETTKQDEYLQYSMNKSYNKRFISDEYWQKVKLELSSKITKELDKSQFISLIDLSKQLFILVVWDNIQSDFKLIGSDVVSTGDMLREKNISLGDDHYFDSPIGFFKVKSGWRSSGKILDDNITLPYGKKDRFVFYFGKQNSVRYNTFDQNGKKMMAKDDWKLITDSFEFAMHAHKSIYQLGKKASHGCIRMSDDLNLFIDNNFVLHENILNDGEWLHPYAKAPIEPRFEKLAGKYLIIFDRI